MLLGGARRRPLIQPGCFSGQYDHGTASSDTVEVTHYLWKRFGQDKIYLAAHSGETVFAIQAAAE
ncbi:MAG: hypothetical protein SCK57_04980 [Bacillota bacterium]|nr:hypothetical protein [Bacillota bacterium]MDW7676995.1 hypothetical protein [Bacillota bacterium]